MNLSHAIFIVLLLCADTLCAIDEISQNPNHPYENHHIYQSIQQYVSNTDGGGGGGSSSGIGSEIETHHPRRNELLLSKPPSSSKKSEDDTAPASVISSTNPYRIRKQFPYAPILYDPTGPHHSEPEGRFGWRLVIKPSPVSARLVVKRIDESLNLTCTLEYVGVNHPITGGEGQRLVEGVHNKNDTTMTTTHQQHEQEELLLGEEQVFRLAWHLPIMPQNSKNRVSFQDFHNSKHLIVDHLKESDGGEYECTANALVDSSDKLGLIPPFVESIQILVKPKKGSCNEPLVLCSSGECIAKRFMCDGKPDCKDRADESFDNCGTYHPCDGKLRCSDGRCISPYWCCDRTIDKNCSSLVQSPCCAQLKHIPFLLETHYGPQPQHYNEMGFLQTTIYTVIGCSMAFMLIITIMVVAICRVHLRRTALAQMNHINHHHDPHSMRSTLGSGGPTPFGDILFNSGGGMPYTATASGLLVTYNINNGVQFMGRPMNPPPYSEQPSLPPREGPPPPYCSVENLALSGAEGLSGNPEGASINNPPSSNRHNEEANTVSSPARGGLRTNTTSSPPSSNITSGSSRNADTAPQQDAEIDDASAVSQPLLRQTNNSTSNDSAVTMQDT